uniref:Connector enhancer of kinase suppressor of Ras 1 n=1 Tax=Labrus bergylta TaxID=56723 RepID=A0A3Q3EFY5_9LABR
MEPITSWSEERVSEWLQGLDAPLHQYQVSEWRLSGMDLLQLTSKDLEKLGVFKIGHQELILEAVEKLCSLTYGMGGENLRSLTEKLRAVAHTLQMGIQSSWRRNSYDGGSTVRLPAGVLQVVVELITSAKGLFSLLNRYQFSQLSGYTSSKSILNYCRELGEICRQMVAVCDEILNSSSNSFLTHTAQLESVDLVPVAPGDQLGIEITSTGSSNHYVTGTAAEVRLFHFQSTHTHTHTHTHLTIAATSVNDVGLYQVGWSRANLVKKLKENPSGVTLVLKKIPGSVRHRDPVLLSPQQGEEEDNPRHSIFERVAASVRSLSFSRRRVSCRELGKPDCDGWLWKKRKESGVFITQKWQRFWFILTGPSLYWYTSQQDEKAEGFVNISSFDIESAGEHKRKNVFQMCHRRFHNFVFAADNLGDMTKCQNSQSSSYHLCRFLPLRLYLSLTLLPSGGPVDEMGMMLNNIKEGGVTLIGSEQPFTHDHFRKSFIRRNKNPVINEKAHTLRALQSTLKAKEAELLQINKLLEESSLTPSKYRQWKESNEELIQEIERVVSLKAAKEKDGGAAQGTPAEEVASETVATETAAEGAYRLSLSDGEQLVDAEPADGSPVLELSLGSLQESINKQLSEMAESGEATENYFYI